MGAKTVPFATLVGKTIVAVRVNLDDEIRLRCADGNLFRMYHRQSCCESVNIEDIDGDIQRLVGQEIVVAEERQSHDNPPPAGYVSASFTWTFYVLRTNLDSVTIRWFGTSNGYYSETVDFEQIG